MDLARLRSLLRPRIIALKDAGTHETLPSICDALTLPVPTGEGSKRDRMTASFEAVADADLPRIAKCYLCNHTPTATVRNEIQDLLWADTTIEIPRRARREIARELENQTLYLDGQKFDDLLDRLWILDDDPLSWLVTNNRSLRILIQKHIHRNPGDWSAETLFDELGAFDASDRRFALFIEGLASPDVRPDEAAQRHFVEVVNRPLNACGTELREIDTEGGYPVFRIVSTRESSMGRPKNLIFASSVKPDLRFRDAVNNDIEIVTNADRVLVYDRPIGNDGLSWRELQTWWKEMNGMANDEESKKTLYWRLRESLPPASPPQKMLFEEFFRSFRKQVPDLPALLPEVWLHWDPKTAKERGAEALTRFRMDFLLLLPNGIRVVIEVDGRQHYADESGKADVTRYAKMAAADRELKLAGYQVFRFGGAELQGNGAPKVVETFFMSLFKRFGVR